MSTLAEIWREGQTLLDAKKRRQFIDYTYKALREVPQQHVGEAYGTHFDRLIFVCQQLPDLAEIAERCAALSDWDYARNGETAWGLLGRGVGALASGDLDLMDTCITLSAGKPLFKRWTIALGVFNHRPPSYLAHLHKAGTQPALPTTFSFNPTHEARTDDIILLVSCDSGYLRQFAAPAFRSSRAAGDALIHCHIVNPNAEDMQFVRDLAAEGGRINVSTESSPFVEGLGPGRGRAGYLINPRFIHAPRLLEHYQRPLFISDIDAAILSPWSEIKEALAPYDVGIRRVAGQYPWRKNAAGSGYFAPTESGKLFANLVSLYIRSALDLTTHKINWLIDQNALFCAERTMALLGAPLNAIPLTNAHDYTRLAQYFDGGKEGFKAANAVGETVLNS
ncbi:MAG: hypothetical protein BroJett013_07440 [Alphaproteobacteria bacterium]|nr:MAG: hypothetical protein BroJett013_07440 [Alphaproteobacteria bacterium]